MADETGVAVIPSRMPLPNIIAKEFDVTPVMWKSLVDVVFPLAKSPDSVAMALAYCKSRNLDVMKRVVHIVPIYDSKKRDYVETIWPGIAELRTTAMRTKEYAGCSEAVFGPDITEEFEWVSEDYQTKKERVEKITITYPEYAQMTVRRIVGGHICDFAGPKVYWKESYASKKGGAPNAMWAKRPKGQIDKVSEAAALRRAFPEELGNQYSAEEMEGQTLERVVEITGANSGVGERLGTPVKEGFNHSNGHDAGKVQDAEFEDVKPEQKADTKPEPKTEPQAEAETNEALFEDRDTVVDDYGLDLSAIRASKSQAELGAAVRRFVASELYANATVRARAHSREVAWQTYVGLTEDLSIEEIAKSGMISKLWLEFYPGTAESFEEGVEEFKKQQIYFGATERAVSEFDKTIDYTRNRLKEAADAQ